MLHHTGFGATNKELIRTRQMGCFRLMIMKLLLLRLLLNNISEPRTVFKKIVDM